MSSASSLPDLRALTIEEAIARVGSRDLLVFGKQAVELFQLLRVGSINPEIEVLHL